MITVLLIGNGNIASHLHAAFLTADHIAVTKISSRNLEHIPYADITIIAVSDDAIAEVSSQIKNPFVVHTSGACEIGRIEKHHTQGSLLYVTNLY